jgi:hypothetical protein
MAKSKAVQTTPDYPVVVTASADATATGEDTFAATEAVVKVVDRGPVTVALGTMTANATATAEGDVAYATAYTEATADGADISIGQTATSESDGATTASSTTRFVAVAIEGVDFERGPIAVSSDHEVESQPAAIDGNTATFDVDVTAIGDNAHVTANTTVITTDQLSDSTIIVSAMAETALF